MVPWGAQTIPICVSCQGRLEAGEILKGDTFRWRSLRHQAPWCAVAETRLCIYCAVPDPGKAVTEQPVPAEQSTPGAGRGLIDRFLRRPLR